MSVEAELVSRTSKTTSTVLSRKGSLKTLERDGRTQASMEVAVFAAERLIQEEIAQELKPKGPLPEFAVFHPTQLVSLRYPLHAMLS